MIKNRFVSTMMKATAISTIMASTLMAHTPTAYAGQHDVFVVGTGAVPNPALIDPSSSSDLNPASALSGMTSFNNRGAWAASTSYAVGDEVTINGLTYLAVEANTSSSSFSTDATSGYWILRNTWANTDFNTSRFLGLASYSSKGAWSSGTVYSLGDMVTSNGVSYVCTSAHKAGSSISSGISSGSWVMRSSCPSLSSYTQDTPVGATCEDFDAYFQSGTSVFKSTTKIFEDDILSSGVPIEGTVEVTLTFDWDAETVTGTGKTILTNYPNITNGGSTFNMDSIWSGYSFHQGNTCGRFKLFSYKIYSLNSSTCSGISSYGFDTHVNFHEKNNKFIPVIHFTPAASASPLDNVEFYTSAFGSSSCGNSMTRHYINAERGNMK